jgi:hypothetical protein
VLEEKENVRSLLQLCCRSSRITYKAVLNQDRKGKGEEKKRGFLTVKFICRRTVSIN